ncbi:DUF4244 domain-containing protein [uncultured Kocuria sp.]|uniref:DUF4244 domain-containing protein n=1 Tax=uncultured Kocuria sp. TaxID=259305 RepID=UPI002627C415|nr:DUF4244 domain-containing protein [uncultured Kocuria sp.]
MSQHQIAPSRPARKRRSLPGLDPGALTGGRTAAPSARGTTRPRPLARTGDADLGATTVEYAMVVLAAAAFGGVMAAVLSSGQVRELLTAIIEKALGV